MEEFGKDFDYIVAKKNLTELRGVDANSAFNQSTQKKAEETQDEKIARYFAQLSRKVRAALFRLYRIDFEMFGYDGLKYVN